jgi:hypothetical protein
VSYLIVNLIIDELRDEFKLDGTHLNPNYDTLLTRALVNVE